MLATTRGLGVGRFGQMRFEPRRGDLLDDIPPTGAALDRQRDRATSRSWRDVVAQPPPEPLPVGLPEPAPPRIAGLHIECIERDLPSVQIQPTYHRHQGPPRSNTDASTTTWLSAHEPRRSSHIECSGMFGCRRIGIGMVGRPERVLRASCLVYWHGCRVRWAVGCVSGGAANGSTR
jgi:hypothetical protein